MTNPTLLASGIGMIAVGVLPVIYWGRSRRIVERSFVFGAVLWIIAIAPKIVLDVTIGGAMDSWANYMLGSFGAFVFFSAYVGLRTGAFESGFSYLAFLKTRLKAASYDDAIAFGLAFGGTEAVVLGLGSFANILLFLLNPGLMNQVPVSQREALLAALNAPTSIVFAPIIERTFVIPIHLFATVLLYTAVVTRKYRFFWSSFLYRTAIDATVPAFSQLLGQSPGSLVTIYVIEMIVVAYGIIGLVGTRWLRSRLQNSLGNRTSS